MFDETCNHGADVQEVMKPCCDDFVHHAEIKKAGTKAGFLHQADNLILSALLLLGGSRGSRSRSGSIRRFGGICCRGSRGRHWCRCRGGSFLFLFLAGSYCRHGQQCGEQNRVLFHIFKLPFKV
jgi:hypothetical protein